MAESLKPWYRQFCKRPCFHDEYLQSFARSNVHLVDTDGQGIEHITSSGIVANGIEYPLDCIVFATGFEVGTGYARRAGYETIGRDGVSLTDYWDDGVRTLHGIHSVGFPNNFIVSATQGAFTVNYPHLLTEVAQHISYIIDQARQQGAEVVEVTPDAEQAWVDTIIEKARDGAAFQDACTPGYYNNEGQPSGRATQNTSYGGGSIAFFKILDDWRTDGTLAGLTLT